MIISANNVSKSYQRPDCLFLKKRIEVLHNVTINVAKGECVGLIGESGSGKSTLGRVMLGIEKPEQGSVCFKDMDIYAKQTSFDKRKWQSCISTVFQDYTSSVNSMYTVRDILMEPMRILGTVDAYSQDKITDLLEKVGLAAKYLKRYPHELSGGQLQRICIARALTVEPEFVLLDEPVSSLDISIQVQVLDLLAKLQSDLGLSYLFITHDLAAVTYFCHRASFLYKGKIVESTSNIEQLACVKGEYARKLLHSVPLVMAVNDY